MVEGEQLADIHHELHEKLMNEVHQSANQWKKDNYHKSLMNYKEVKSSEEGFSKAQKPWARRLDEGILLYKRDTHKSLTSCSSTPHNKPSTSCFRIAYPMSLTSLEQFVDNIQQACLEH